MSGAHLLVQIFVSECTGPCLNVNVPLPLRVWRDTINRPLQGDTNTGPHTGFLSPGETSPPCPSAERCPGPPPWGGVGGPAEPWWLITSTTLSPVCLRAWFPKTYFSNVMHCCFWTENQDWRPVSTVVTWWHALCWLVVVSLFLCLRNRNTNTRRQRNRLLRNISVLFLLYLSL